MSIEGFDPIKDAPPEGFELCLSIRGGVFRARCWGPANGTRWLAFHGWLDNANSFEPLAKLLPSLRLVAVDLAGHGWSPWRESGAYHLADYAADGYMILKELGWLDHCNLIGHSLGSGVAVLVASMMGERCGRLVLLDGLGPHTIPDEEAPPLLRDALSELCNIPEQKVYSNLRAAATRRQEGNIVGSITLEACLLLCARGCKPAPPEARASTPTPQASTPSGTRANPAHTPRTAPTSPSSISALEHSPIVWTADPAVKLKSRVRLSSGVVRAFLRSVQCPTLCVLPADGMLKAALRWDILKGSIFSLFSLFVGKYLVWLCLQIARLIKRRAWVKKCEQTLYYLEWGLDLVLRVRAMRELKVMTVRGGGHHAHMTQPVEVAKKIVDWLAEKP